MKSKRLRQMGLLMLVCAAGIALAVATSPASQAAAPSPLESKYEPMGPLPIDIECLAAVPGVVATVRPQAAGHALANGCVQYLT